MLGGVLVLPLIGQSLLPEFKERDFLMHWLTIPGTGQPEMFRISARANHDLLEIPGVRNAGSHIGQALLMDEVVGMLITLFLIPVGWAGAFGAFLLFRLADVVKPYPANRFESLHGGLGVMADDCMAGVYANLALRAILALGNRVIG